MTSSSTRLMTSITSHKHISWEATKKTDSWIERKWRKKKGRKKKFLYWIFCCCCDYLTFFFQFSCGWWIHSLIVGWFKIKKLLIKCERKSQFQMLYAKKKLHHVKLPFDLLFDTPRHAKSHGEHTNEDLIIIIHSLSLG